MLTCSVHQALFCVCAKKVAEMLDRKRAWERHRTHRAHTRGRACRLPEDGLASQAKLACTCPRCPHGVAPVPGLAGGEHRGRQSWRRQLVACALCRASEMGRHLAVALMLAGSASCGLALFAEEIDSSLLMSSLRCRVGINRQWQLGIFDNMPYTVELHTTRCTCTGFDIPRP